LREVWSPLDLKTGRFRPLLSVDVLQPSAQATYRERFSPNDPKRTLGSSIFGRD